MDKNWWDELEKLTGLREVKTKIKEIVTFIKKRGTKEMPTLHMVFRGNPGTGKTTVARLIGKIFATEGILPKKNVFVETDREGLIAAYVGHTAIKTKEVIQRAMGGILFIDEAYALHQDGRDFGGEAIATLVKKMEDRRKDFICIMAGYSAEMDEMLNMNPGLRDRVQFYIDFPDYDANEFCEIFDTLSKEKEYELSGDGEEVLRQYFQEIITNKDKNFSNGRLVRKIFERIQIKQVMSDREDNIILKEHIDEVFRESDMKNFLTRKTSNKTIGFRHN